MALFRREGVQLFFEATHKAEFIEDGLSRLTLHELGEIPGRRGFGRLSYLSAE